MSKNKPRADKANVVRHGNVGLIDSTIGVYAFTIGAATSDNWTTLLDSSSVSWESDPQIVHGKKIFAYGAANDMPVEIRKVMDENHLAPGILEREIGLLWGQGPHLYEDVYENNDVVRKWDDDREIWSFMESFDYERYILMAMVYFKYLKSFFSKRVLKKGRRIGKNFIDNLEIVHSCDARLEWVESQNLRDVNNIFVGDFENNCNRGMQTFPRYRRNDPFRHGASMEYYCGVSFGRRAYAMPGYYGALNWIKRSSDIPQILKYLTDNGLAVSFHIHSPAQYWEEKRDKLEKRYPDKDEKFVDGKLEELKDETFKKIGEVLAGKKNTGKFIETVDFFDEEANQMVSWKIEAIEQKVKDFIDAQLKISEKSDAATTSGIGLHPSLSNIMVDGKLSSGSEMLYALKLYLASDTAIPEMIIFKGINDAIADMFPNKRKKLGCYHKIVLKEENVSPGDRVQQNV
jgi:hypothetical protein